MPDGVNVRGGHVLLVDGASGQVETEPKEAHFVDETEQTIKLEGCIKVPAFGENRFSSTEFHYSV